MKVAYPFSDPFEFYNKKNNDIEAEKKLNLILQKLSNQNTETNH